MLITLRTLIHSQVSRVTFKLCSFLIEQIILSVMYAFIVRNIQIVKIMRYTSTINQLKSVNLTHAIH